jgi:SAM-dependent methyltransferase
MRMTIDQPAPSCPLCESPDTFLVKSIDPEVLIEAWGKVFGIDVSTQFQDLESVDLFQCARCHLQHFAPNSLTGSSDLYAQLQSQELPWFYMAQKWEYGEALKDLQKCGTALEVGCGVGHFVAQALAAGLNVKGIEVNPSAVQQAQQQGLPVQLFDLCDAASQGEECYDAACSFQVLEHVPNPKEFLGWMCALTKPGGTLVLGLPNADSFLRYQFNILDMPPHHMTRWSSKVLNSLPSFFPLKLDHISLEPLAKYHVGGYVEAYRSIVSRHSALRNLCHPRLGWAISKFLAVTRLHRFLKGQTVYACFTRIG